MIVEVTVNEYRGIGIEEFRTDEGKLGYHIAQEGLIKKTLSTTGMAECKGKATTTSGEAP